MTDEQFETLSEGEQNTCSLCSDWNLGDCEKCELMEKIKRSDISDSERMASACKEY